MHTVLVVYQAYGLNLFLIQNTGHLDVSADASSVGVVLGNAKPSAGDSEDRDDYVAYCPAVSEIKKLRILWPK